MRCLFTTSCFSARGVVSVCDLDKEENMYVCVTARAPVHVDLSWTVQVLEMLAYLTFFGPGISQDVWKTWPRMHALVMDFGIDYWEVSLRVIATPQAEQQSCNHAEVDV